MMDEEDRRLEQLVRLHRAARERMDRLDDAARGQFIADQFEQGNIVYGVWVDATKPRGIDYVVLKSSERLESRRPGLIWETVVPCESREHAIRIRTMFLQP